MGLAEDRRIFFKIRTKCEIIVKKHAFIDYPERGFSEKEIISLVKNGKGELRDNYSPEAISGSYLFFVEDEWEQKCKLVILMEIMEIQDKESEDQVIVCSAYRGPIK